MYKITITKEEQKDTIEQEYKQVADTGNKRDGGPVYDYVDHKTTEKVETLLYTQRTENLDLKQVIDAVNNQQMQIVKETE